MFFISLIIPLPLEESEGAFIPPPCLGYVLTPQLLVFSTSYSSVSPSASPFFSISSLVGKCPSHFICRRHHD